jgi:Methyltransferase domain
MRYILLASLLLTASLKANDQVAMAQAYYSTWANLKVAEVSREQGGATSAEVERLRAQLDQLRQQGFNRPDGALYEGINILPEDPHGWFYNEAHLRHIIQKNGVKKVIEVGSWMGRSTIAIAKLLPPEGVIYAVDHFLGSSEHQAGAYAHHPSLSYLYQQFLSNVVHNNVTHKVVPVRMSSLEAARAIKVAPDLIYLDGSHDTAAVYSDLVAWWPFVERNGILCGDDESWPSVMAAVSRFAAEKGLLIERRYNLWVLRKPGEPPRLP